MRRSTKLLIAALSSVTLLACEDGPNQTYSPAPAGAGDLFNSGFDPGKTPVIDPGKSNLESNPGKGSSRQEICDADTKRTTWAKAIASEIKPPRSYGGIDMAGDDTYRGITVEQADLINCQSVSDGNGGVHWGDNSEIQFFYDVGTHIVTQMVLNLGYSGKIKVKGRKPNSGQDCYNYVTPVKDGSGNIIPDTTCPHQNDTYEIGVGGLPLKNNAPWLFDPNSGPDWDPKITEFYDAVISAYMPEQTAAPSCGQNAACLELGDDGAGNVIWGIRPAAVYFVTHAHTAQPVLSTPYYIYNFFIKILPYSNAAMTVKIDAEGPFAKATLGTAANPKNCNIKLGQTWQEMLDTCVNVTGDPSIDKTTFNKLVGGRTHTLDDIFFNVVGVNQNVTLQKDTFDYVKDTDLPGPADQTTEWIFDVRARGNVKNDLGPTKRDNHGSARVFMEYMAASQEEIYRIAKTPVALQHNIGDAACFNAATAPVGCTGLEGVLITGPKSSGCLGTYTVPAPPAKPFCTPDASVHPYLNGDLTKQMAGTFFGIFGSLLKPGDPKIVICESPSAAVTGDTSTCMSASGDPINDPGFPLWDGAYQRVINVFGKGDIFNLPPAVRDRRFFFQQYSLALVKYLKAYGTASGITPFVEPTQAQVTGVKLDFENVFFDISDLNQFDKIEYIERDFVDATHEPTNFEYGSDIKVANQRSTKWDRKMSRAERAMYQAFAGKSTAALGKFDHVRLSNMFGSNILTSLWESVNCGTVGTDACGASTLGPWDGNGDYHETGGLDSDGLPLLADYPGAWGNTIFHSGPSQITITGYLNNVQTAKISMPQYTNPYECTVGGVPANDPAPAPPNTICVAATDELRTCAAGGAPQHDGCKKDTGAAADSSTYCCPKGAARTPVQMVQALVPHTPQQPGVGISIPLTGTRDKVISTGDLDFEGNTSNYHVKYNFQTCKAEKLDLATVCAKGQQQFVCNPDLTPSINSGANGDTVGPDPGCKKNATARKDGLDNYCCEGTTRPAFIPTNRIEIRAIDTSDFLGDVFMCKDPITNDILRVRMYDSAQSVLDWLTKHPGSSNACDIIVRYSPFNNYIDKIFARTYGVTLDISKSFGAGRVDDAELWDPALLSQ